MKRGFHGLVVEDGTEDEAHPLAPFFRWFPLVERGAAAALSLAMARRERLPEIAVRAPLFFHGVVQVSATADGYVAEAPRLQVTISGGATRLRLVIEGEGTPPYAAGIVHVALLFALRFHGLYDLHAGAAVFEGQTVLVVGDSGAGKTTTTLALALPGGRLGGLLGDDRVLVREDDPLTLLAYPRSLHLGPTTRGLFPELPAWPVAGEAKAEAEIPTGTLTLAGAAVAAILLPHITDAEETSVTRATAADAFGQLLVSAAIAFVDGVPGRDAHLACLQRLATIPAYHLALGQDARVSPSVIAATVRRIPVFSLS